MRTEQRQKVKETLTRKLQHKTAREIEKHGVYTQRQINDMVYERARKLEERKKKQQKH